MSRTTATIETSSIRARSLSSEVQQLFFEHQTMPIYEMKFDRQHSVDTMESDELDREDHYFQCSSLHFPLSPKSVRKEMNCSLMPLGLNSPNLSLAAKKTIQGDEAGITLQKRKPHRLDMSPGSEGTDSTADMIDDASLSGSLAYSVESVDMNFFDKLGQLISPREDRTCFQLLEGIMFAVWSILPRAEPRTPRTSAYFHFDEYFAQEKKKAALQKRVH